LPFHLDAGALGVNLKETSGSGFARTPPPPPLARRKLLDDAELRALRADRSDD